MTLAFLAALALQDAPDLAEWVRRLGDDSIEIREEATQELLRAGEGAEPLLRKALDSASAEVRARASTILAERERNERAREFDRGPSLITLHRKEAPVAEVLQEIRRQSATGLTFPDIPETERVTVDFERTPFFSAIDGVCRSHGGLQWWRHRDAAGLHAVGVQREPYAPLPQVIADQYMLRLMSARARKGKDGAGGETSMLSLEFAWAWERGTQPAAARVRLDEIKDEAGARYVAPLLEMETTQGVGTRPPPSNWTFMMPCGRPDPPKTLAVVKGCLELLLPEGMDEFVFENPEQGAGTVRKSGNVEVRLVSLRRDGNRVHAGIEVRPPEAAEHLGLKLAEEQSRLRSGGRWATVSQGSDRATLYLEFTAPEGPMEALRLVRPTRLRERSVPFEFRDLELR